MSTRPFGTVLLVVIVSLICIHLHWETTVEAIACKTRIVYKTVHVPVHVVKKVPIIKKVPVPIYMKQKHHLIHKHKHEMPHQGGLHSFNGQDGFGEF
ncbi:hypothetical protein RDWZM_008477 [Blomia tropicalis]|uniref:Uncharacterized protein n=1 Tax=Blomia tropicalis TaxID=40697 RepID=A0A9Q0M126_BLOTA|nr:hypothetical protein BLOT_011041 [Blomia tropicalis]KAJ6217320.1 hypothetical protein RDWZM_008477 [Blomia tropicalis]